MTIEPQKVNSFAPIRVTNTIKDTDGNTMFDFNDYFKVNRLWKTTDDISTGTKTNYSIKGLKEFRAMYRR